MKAVDLLINSKLPVDLRRDSPSLDAKGLSSILADVAQKYPDRYEEISQGLADIGREAAFRQGETIGMDDLRPVVDRKALYKEMDRELKDAQREFGHDKAELRRKKEEIWVRYSDRIEKLTGETALKNLNNIALSVASGARGKSQQLKAMISTPGVYTDSKGNLVPMFIRRSYSEGLRPAEYLAGTYGARLSVTGAKLCLAEGTLVRMADGSPRPIEKITPGDWVLGVRSDYSMSAPVLVTRLWDQGLQDVYRWEFKNKQSDTSFLYLHATESHKILACSLREYRRQASRYARATISGKSISKPDPETRHVPYVVPVGAKDARMAAVLAPPVESFSGTTTQLAWVWGLLTGDGCVSHSTQVSGSRLVFSCADPTLIKELNTDILNPMGLKVRGHSKGNYNCEITRIAYSAADNASVQKGITGFVKGARFPEKLEFEETGLRGKYAWEKEFPPQWDSWSYSSKVDFLAGLFSADGGFGRRKCGGPEFGYGSTSKKLIDQVQEALVWMFGVPKTKIKIRTKNRKRPFYSFVNSARCDLERLTPVIRRMLGEKRKTYFKLLEEQGPLKQRNPRPVSYKIDKQRLGNIPCFDLEVESENHLFVLANGLVVSNSTARGGDLGKQLANTAATQVVTEKDCGSRGGLEFGLDEPSLPGRVLAQDAGSLKAGTVLGKAEMRILHKEKPGNVVVRSAMTCQAPKGLCSFCLGRRSGGKFASVGDSVGIEAAQTVSEPFIQSGLGSKHTAGMAKGKKSFSGLDYIAQFAQSPETFKDRAAVAEEDGVVSAVEKAPQGGYFVTVNDEKQYVPPGFEVIVKQGDQVEAGDQLSEGLIDPEDIVRLRGLGEGRKYYAERLHQILEDSGHGGDRRNMEILARAAVDHVRIDDSEGLGDYLPDDIASYNRLSADYTPPENTQKLSPRNAIGQYLQAPVLHYTIGTRITPRVAKHLGDRNQDIFAAPDAPQFSPQLRRLRTAAANVDRGGFISGMTGSYLKDNLQFHASRGTDEDIGSNIHYAPRLAAGTGFSEKVRETGEF